MGWPKGKKREKPSHSKATSTHHVSKTCATCGEEKRLRDFPYATWRKRWKSRRKSDPSKYSAHCKDCARYTDAGVADPAFEPDRRPRKTGRPRKDRRTDAPQTVEEKRAYMREYKMDLRARTRAQCLRYLAKKGCADCGIRDPRVLEFDHLDPKTKAGEIAKMISQGYSWANDKLRKEIRKCRVMCANCHRIHTIEQQGYYNHDTVRKALGDIFRQYQIDPGVTRRFDKR